MTEPNGLLAVVHLLATVLACWRLTDLMAMDQITAPLRARVPWYLLSCVRCLSVWAGLVVTAIYIVVPWLNWPLALSWLYLWFIESKGPYIHVKITPKGLNLTSSLNRETASSILAQTLALLKPQANPPA